MTVDFRPDKIDAAAHATVDAASSRQIKLVLAGNARPRTSAQCPRHRRCPDHERLSRADELDPELVLCSPAKRTRQTADAIKKGFPEPVEILYADRLYEATPDTILSLVRSVAAEVHSLLVIGHNPGLHESARLLVAAGDVERRERLNEKYPTAALAVIDFPIDAWSKLHRSPAGSTASSPLVRSRRRQDSVAVLAAATVAPDAIFRPCREITEFRCPRVRSPRAIHARHLRKATCSNQSWFPSTSRTPTLRRRRSKPPSRSRRRRGVRSGC